MRLPASGAVLGIDVGWSAVRPSSAVCRLDWTADTVDWTIRRFRATDAERTTTIEALADRRLLAAALDGPLRRGFDEIGAYRRAEQLLTLGFAPLIGKPGQSNSPGGRELNRHANACARALVDSGRVGLARHPQAIDHLAIVEAFPSAWLGMLIAEPDAIGAVRGDRSDRYYEHLVQSGGLAEVLARLLPGRTLATPFATVTNHDDRAALVCALTALGLAAGDYGAVGDAQGWIVLPPPALVRPWARDILAANAARCGGGVEMTSPTSGAGGLPTRHAACRCGQLQAVCAGEPVRVSVCHCLDCQRRSGSAFAAQARWPVEAVAITGTSNAWTHRADRDNAATFHFCPTCGTTVYYSSRPRRDLIAIPIGTFADPGFPAPNYSVYEGRQQEWVRIVASGTEHYD